MIVHLSCSRECVAKNISSLRKIINTIHASGGILARDWIEPQYHLLSNSMPSIVTPEEIFRQNMDAIHRADIVIIDNTFKSFSNGFQAAVALQKKRPLMLLTKQGSDENRLSMGAEDLHLTKKKYSNDDLDEIVTGFIRKYIRYTKDLRFNFVIDRRIDAYLRRMSYELGKTKAEVVRDMVLNDIAKNSSNNKS